MQKEQKRKFRCIECGTAAEFQAEVQQIIDEHPEAVVTFHQVAPRLAYVEWTEKVRICETAKDRFEEQGIRLRCSSCQHYEYPQDMRRKWTRCNLTGLPVHEDTAACEVCYQMEMAKGGKQ